MNANVIQEYSSGFLGWRCTKCSTWKYNDESHPWSCDCNHKDVPLQVTITKDIKAGGWVYRLWQDFGHKTVTHCEGVTNTFRSAAGTCASTVDIISAREQREKGTSQKITKEVPTGWEFANANSGGAWSRWQPWTENDKGFKPGDTNGGYRKWRKVD